MLLMLLMFLSRKCFFHKLVSVGINILFYDVVSCML